MWPLGSWLKMTEALQEEESSRLEQTSNRGGILWSSLGWQNMEAAPVENEVEQPGKSSRKHVILLLGDSESLRLGLCP